LADVAWPGKIPTLDLSILFPMRANIVLAPCLVLALSCGGADLPPPDALPPPPPAMPIARPAPPRVDPSRALEGRALENLVAFAHLLERASEALPDVDFDDAAVEAAKQAEEAPSVDELARVLESVFAKAAPGIRVFPALRQTEGRPNAASEIDLGAGISCLLPPRPPTTESPSPRDPAKSLARSLRERETRLAAFALAMTALSRLHPRREALRAILEARLRPGLSEAAEAEDEAGMRAVMERSIAPLGDGHGAVLRVLGVSGGALVTEQDELHRPPIDVAFVEGALVVTNVSPALGSAVFVGDEIAALGGLPVAAWMGRNEPRIPGATRARRLFVASGRILSGTRGEKVTLVLTHASGEKASVEVSRSVPLREAMKGASGREPLGEIAKGIARIEVVRTNVAALDAAWPSLSRGRALIVDLRGEGEAGEGVLERLASILIEPKTPSFRGKVVFVVDESVSGLRESFASSAAGRRAFVLVGQETAGASGEARSILLPGGLLVRFGAAETAGIAPRVLARRTLAGARAGRDEIMERAIEVASGKTTR